jgi:cyclopropane fatty-acyl-phospholipid synthase-like methyltransferase
MFLKRHDFVKAMGVDLCKELVDFQKQELGLSAVHGDAIAFLRDAKPGFELITATDFLEHLSKDEIIEFLCLACDKLSPTGRLFVQVPNMGNPFNTRGQFGDFTHEVAFTERSLEFAVTNSGFPHVKIISNFPGDKEPEQFITLRQLYAAIGNARAPKVLSSNVIAICGHQPID